MKEKIPRTHPGRRSRVLAGKSGQITIEFLIALGFLTLIFGFSLYVFSEKNSGFIHSKNAFNAKLLAQELSGCINSVFLAGDGAETRVLLKDKGDFNVSVSNGSVQVSYGSEYASSKVFTGNITVKSISLGGAVNVKNTGGGIIIENA